MKHIKLFEEYSESGYGMNLSTYIQDIDNYTNLDGMNVHDNETGMDASIQDNGLEEESLPDTLNVEDCEDGSPHEADVDDLTVTEEM